MQKIIKVVCPNCHELLQIQSNNVKDLENHLLTCPKCSYKAKIANYMQGSNANGEQSADDEPTQVNFDSIGAMDRTIGSLYIGEKEFALKKGRTLIGRLATTSHSDMQIPTDDRYMSRSHAYITVKVGASGLEHQLEPASPKNPIKLNGQIIDNGDIIVLKWGDKLMFGHTEVIFEKPKYIEEGTALET